MFQPDEFGTLEEHVTKHNFPQHLRTCGPCKFWKNGGSGLTGHLS